MSIHAVDAATLCQARACEHPSCLGSDSLAGASPLQTAASVGHVEVLKLLIGRPQAALAIC
jgi:hypothetical protein